MPMFLCNTPPSSREAVLKILQEGGYGGGLVEAKGFGPPDHVLEPSDCWIVVTNETNVVGVPEDLMQRLTTACSKGDWAYLYMAQIPSAWGLVLVGNPAKMPAKIQAKTPTGKTLTLVRSDDVEPPSFPGDMAPLEFEPA